MELRGDGLIGDGPEDRPAARPETHDVNCRGRLGRSRQVDIIDVDDHRTDVRSGKYRLGVCEGGLNRHHVELLLPTLPAIRRQVLRRQLELPRSGAGKALAQGGQRRLPRPGAAGRILEEEIEDGDPDDRFVDGPGRVLDRRLEEARRIGIDEVHFPATREQDREERCPHASDGSPSGMPRFGSGNPDRPPLDASARRMCSKRCKG